MKIFCKRSLSFVQSMEFPFAVPDWKILASFGMNKSEFLMFRIKWLADLFIPSKDNIFQSGPVQGNFLLPWRKKSVKSVGFTKILNIWKSDIFIHR